MARRWTALIFFALLASAGCSNGQGPASADVHPDAAGPGDATSAADAGPLGPEDAGGADASSALDAEVPVPRVRTYLALGSSSTYGSGASSPDKAYVELLAARLRTRFPDLSLVNLGRGGATVDVFLGALEQIRVAEPELVTVLPFTDYVATSTKTFETSYARLLDALGPLGATVFFGDLTVDPALVCGVGRGPGGCYSADDQAKLGAKSAILAHLAATRPWVTVVPVLDQNVAHPEWIAPDGAHPNDLGHAYLADTFWAPIDAWLH